jgi:hypothetical protein
MKTNRLLKASALASGAFMAVTGAQASTDYGPAIWHAICNANWYTTGSGHKFHVIHDMEGYYATTVAWFDNCSMTSASVHFAVNGKKDATSDAAAGEITQLGVRTSQYAWHARCWNQHSTGTEHEGFASNPAWYTDAQYSASAGITAHMAAVFGWPKDRNHIVGHGEKSRSAWVSWASANLGIDPNCNTHTDPGPNWDWSKYMGMVNPSTGKTAVIKDNPSGVATGTWATGTSSTDKYGADYRFHSTAAISEPFTWSTGLNTSATWNVRAWWTQGSNRNSGASYIVSHSGGTTTVVKNQQTGGGAWQLLGSWSMSTGQVQLSCWDATGFVVVADAIKWD